MRCHRNLFTNFGAVKLTPKGIAMGTIYDAVRQRCWSFCSVIMLVMIGGCGGSLFIDAMQTEALSPAKKLFVPKTATYKYSPMEYLAAACNIDPNRNKSIQKDSGTIPPWVPLTFEDVQENSQLYEIIRFVVLEDEECMRIKEKVALVDSMLSGLQLSDENQRMRHSLMLIKGFCYYECKEYDKAKKEYANASNAWPASWLPHFHHIHCRDSLEIPDEQQYKLLESKYKGNSIKLLQDTRVDYEYGK